ncbi:MAG: O-antigen ligase family protein [Gaiellales bacterium]
MADAAAPAVRARAAVPDLAGLAVGVVAAAGMGALAAADGGYFAPAWGWTALIGLWLAAAWLLLGRVELRAALLGVTFLGAVAGLTAWTWLSLLWTENDVQTMLEGFRVLAYLGVAAALLLVVRRATAPALLRGVLAAITLVATYALATRLFPDRLGSYDPVATYRLSEPLGYWNGLGIFCAMGALLALGIVARDRSLVARCLAGVSFTLLVSTLYFTFSRGGWIALGIGFLAAFALDPRRLQLAVALLVVGVPAGIATWIGSTSEALTVQDSPLSAAVEQGQEVALIVALVALLAAAAVAGLAFAEGRFVATRTLRLAFAGALAVAAAAILVGSFARFGGPIELVDRAYDAFTAAPPQQSPADLGERLFTFTGGYRAELWEEAWDDYRANPVLGSGPGTYGQYWNQHRPIPHIVRDAHNLYLEVLAELGPLGLALLVLALGAPLAAAVGARREPLAIGAFGAYVAYLAHAAVDWDWELLGVTVPALACGVALLTLRPDRSAPVVPGPPVRLAGAVAAIGLAMVAFVGLVGSSAMAASEEAAQESPPDYAKARDEARKARRWARWSSEPWQRLGEAQLGAGDTGAARGSFGRAIAKEPGDWFLWFRLAEASTGAERERALAEASRLNPLSPELAEFRAAES